MNQRLFCFSGAAVGPWRVTAATTVIGAPLAAVSHLSVLDAGQAVPANSAWLLRGVTSNERYVQRDEKDRLVRSQQGLARAEARLAALIPLKKNADWWALTQDERRRIFEEDSAHIAIGMRYLPAIARRLHHCRDLATAEPFDFLTWFEFAPAHAAAFDELLAALRATREWQYVDRECEIRLERAGG
jgi:chlorite dismutase